MKIGIIATGRMAGIAASTIRQMSDVQCIAVASRDKWSLHQVRYWDGPQ